MFAGAAIAAKGGGGNASDGVISVPDAVHGGMTVNPGGESAEVFVQCYAPDFGGAYVYAAYFPVNESNQAVTGPLWSTLWPQGAASCRAQEGTSSATAPALTGPVLNVLVVMFLPEPSGAAVTAAALGPISEAAARGSSDRAGGVPVQDLSQ